jgi:hypothetical protein
MAALPEALDEEYRYARSRSQERMIQTTGVYGKNESIGRSSKNTRV